MTLDTGEMPLLDKLDAAAWAHPPAVAVGGSAQTPPFVGFRHSAGLQRVHRPRAGDRVSRQEVRQLTGDRLGALDV